jgi:hypothetical protein
MMLVETTPGTNALLDAALGYAAAGYYVFPTHDMSSGRCSCGATCASPGKHPRTRRGLNDATIDAVTVRAWWGQWAKANIGIDCGRSGLTVVDVDVKKGAQGAATMRWFLERPELPFRDTFMVATPSGGYHFYFAGLAKSGQGTLGQGVDVRGVGGYVLAPPSIAVSQYDEQKAPVPGALGAYAVLQSRPLQPFPAQLLPPSAADDTTIAFGETRAWEGAERPGIPHGEHRRALLWLGWHLRSVQGLTIEGAMPIMRGFVAALEGYDTNRPFTDRDLRGMLTNVKPNIAAAPPPGPGAALSAIVSAAEIIAEEQIPRRIVVPGLMLSGELHVFYGTDGVGKTSLVAYLLALISRMGRDVLVFISEDQPRDFAIKFGLAGGDLGRLHVYSAGRSMVEFLLPKCKMDLEAMIQSRPWGAIYFDSINDYKSTDSRLNAADEARQLYGPLSTLSQQYDMTILCTAHTNARDVLEGARQIRAKARVVARVERPAFEPEQHDDGTVSFGLLQYDPVWTAMTTTEKYSRGKGDAMYAFCFEERISMNPYTQQYDYDIQPDGTRTHKMQYVCTRHEALTDVKAKTPRREVKVDLEAKVFDIVQSCPAFSANDICKQVGGDRSKVLAYIKKARAELGMKP